MIRLKKMQVSRVKKYKHSSEKIIINHGIVLTMDSQKKIITDGAVVIEGNKIIDVGDSKIAKKYKKDVVLDAEGKVIMPGLINAHSHSGLLRGMGDDLPLYEWLKTYVHPEYRVSKPEDAYAAALLNYCESIKAGTTCILDMHNFMDKCADAAAKVGIRAVLAPYVSDQIGYLPKFDENKKLFKDRHKSEGGRINIWCGLHNFRDCSPELLVEAKEFATKSNTGIHTHCNESINDVKLARKIYGKNPIEHLFDYGIAGPNVLLAHCVWLSKREEYILEKTGTKVVHCPVANMKLADGVSPVSRIRQRITVALGTDGTKEANSFDMFRVMKTAALLHRVNELDVQAMSADTVLDMALNGGAKALGLEKEIGSIEVGKKADLIIVNIKNLHQTPLLLGKVSNLTSHLVYATLGSDVETVIVDGNVVMKERKILNLNEMDVIELATRRAENLLERLESAEEDHESPDYISIIK